MANVPAAAVSAPPDDPAKRSEALAGSLRDAGMKSLDHCVYMYTMELYQNLHVLILP